MKIQNKILAPILTGLLLTGCGGGGSTDSPITPTPDTTPAPQTSTMDEQFGKYLNDLADSHILPGYALLLQNAQALNDKAATFCGLNEPSDVDLHLLQLSWLELSLQWQTMQWIKVGAIGQNNRALRLEFWPDSQNAVDKGLAALLGSVENVDAEYVASHNVGGQGIPALEILLFDNALLLTGDDRVKRCEVLQAISTNVVNIAAEVNQAWSPQGGNFVAEFKQGSGRFSSRQDAVEELVTNWLEQLERIKDEKILVPLGDSAPGQLLRSEFYLSHSSLAAIKINLQLFMDIYQAGSGHGFDDILQLHLEQDNIAASMNERLLSLQNHVLAIQGTMEDALQDESARAQLKELIAAIQDFRTVLTADFVQALDINIGFNSNDGD